jgi:hypothetical protein
LSWLTATTLAHFSRVIFIQIISYLVLKLLKTAEGIRSLLDTVGKALPQVSISQYSNTEIQMVHEYLHFYFVK